MSTHAVNVIEIEKVLPHDNAERLEIVPVGGWSAVVGKGQFKTGDKAIYIEPDYVVPTTYPAFEFLAKKTGKYTHRLKAARLRGVLSYGLLIPMPDELKDRPVGDNVMEELGIHRWEPELKLSGAADANWAIGPDLQSPKFDIESLQKYERVLGLGEHVIVTEKVHGANARYVFHDGEFWMGSRRNWLRSDCEHAWRIASDAHPAIRAWCEANQSVVLYGEVFGKVQELKYGREQAVDFAAFAAWDHGNYINGPELRHSLYAAGVPVVPTVYVGPWYPEKVLPLAEKDSTMTGAPKGHMREGIVIVPSEERRDNQGNRVAYKHISNRYWEL